MAPLIEHCESVCDMGTPFQPVDPTHPKVLVWSGAWQPAETLPHRDWNAAGLDWHSCFSALTVPRYRQVKQLPAVTWTGLTADSRRLRLQQVLRCHPSSKKPSFSPSSIFLRRIAGQETQQRTRMDSNHIPQQIWGRNPLEFPQWNWSVIYPTC